jgi:hypothetical protein
MSFNTALRRRYVALLLAGCLTAAITGAITNPAAAGKPAHALPTPDNIVITGVTTGYAPGAGVPDAAVPSLIVKAGSPFDVAVSFTNAKDRPAAFATDTTVTVTVTSHSGTTLDTAIGTALAGATGTTITTTVAAPANRVTLTATAPSGTAVPLSDSTAEFDVLSDVRPDVPAKSGKVFEQGIGGDSGCSLGATPTSPVCGVVLLPRGAGSNVLLSLGACDSVTDPLDLYAPCFAGPTRTDGAVVQSLFSQPSKPYSIDSPATVILKCDKTLCGTGAIRDLKVLYSLGGNDALIAADPCPAKNTMAAALTPCVDYVQSKRDGSGDTHLYLETDGDIRTGIG